MDNLGNFFQIWDHIIISVLKKNLFKALKFLKTCLNCATNCVMLKIGWQSDLHGNLNISVVIPSLKWFGHSLCLTEFTGACDKNEVSPKREKVSDESEISPKGELGNKLYNTPFRCC